MVAKNSFEDVFRYIQIGEPDECWLWTGTITRKGLPEFTVAGKKYIAYRVAKWLVDKSFNLHDQRVVPLHQCKDRDGKAIDNPLCCNPAHTVMGTWEDNMMDMMLKGRSGLTKDVLHDIMKIHDEFGDTLTHGQIAARVKFKHDVNVSRQAVTDILSGRRRAVLQAKIREEDAKLGDTDEQSN